MIADADKLRSYLVYHCGDTWKGMAIQAWVMAMLYYFKVIPQDVGQLILVGILFYSVALYKEHTAYKQLFPND